MKMVWQIRYTFFKVQNENATYRPILINMRNMVGLKQIFIETNNQKKKEGDQQ